MSDLPSELRRILTRIIEDAERLNTTEKLMMELCLTGCEAREWLTALAAPAVKPLVWEEVHFYQWQAKTPFGDYDIFTRKDCRLFYAGVWMQTYPTLEAAQSAAWAHYSERIGGALTKGSDDET